MSDRTRQTGDLVSDNNIFADIVNDRIGIGKKNPTAKLDVNGTVALGSSVYDTNGTFGSDGQVLSNVTGFGVSWIDSGIPDKIEEGNTSAEVIDTGSDGRFVVTTEGAERLRVISNGSVGIATTNPSTLFQVSDSFFIDSFPSIDDIVFVVNGQTGNKLTIYQESANFVVPIIGNLTGTASTASFATTAFNLADAANITTGTISSDRLSGSYPGLIAGNASNADSSNLATNITVTGNDSSIGAGGTFFPLFVDGSSGTQGPESFANLTYDRNLRSLKIDGSLNIRDDIFGDDTPTFIINKTTSSDIVFRTDNTKVTIGDVGAGVSCNINGTVALGSSVYDTNKTFGTNGQVLSSVTGFGVSWVDKGVFDEIVSLGSSVYDTNGTFGSNGQVLSNVTGFGVSWIDNGVFNVTVDKIEEGNTSAEVIDTGSDGRFVVTTEGAERLRVTSEGNVGIATINPSTLFQVSDSFFIDSSGSVGIATTNPNPSTLFQVSDSFFIDSPSSIDDIAFVVNGQTGNKLTIYEESANFAVPIIGNLTGTASTASFAATAFNLADAANITTGTISSDRLTGSYPNLIAGNASTADSSTLATNITVTGNDSGTGAGGTFFPLFVDGSSGTQGPESFANLTYDRNIRSLKIDGSLNIRDDIFGDDTPTFIINKTTSSDIVFRTDNTKVTIGDVGAGVSCNINGDTFVGINTSVGIILTSPNGTQYRLIVENDGTLSTVTI